MVENPESCARVRASVASTLSATDPAPVSMFETIIELKPRSEWPKGMTKDDIIQELNEKLANVRIEPRPETLPSEVSESIGTSTAFAAWNAAIYVAQIEDDRLSEVVSDGRYLQATREVLKQHGGLWFYDESYVISRKRD